MNDQTFADARQTRNGDWDFIPTDCDTWLSFGEPDDDIARRCKGHRTYWLLGREAPGAPVAFAIRGAAADDYSTDVPMNTAVNFIETTGAEGPPFAHLPALASHKPRIPARGHARATPSVPAPPPGLNDVSSRPP